MKLTDLQNVAVPLAITYRGFQIELSYFPEKLFGDEMEAQLAAAADEAEPDAPPAADEKQTQKQAQKRQRAELQRQYKADSELLAKLIATWNIADDGGQALPITADVILKFGPVLRKLLSREIHTDIMRPLASAAS